MIIFGFEFKEVKNENELTYLKYEDDNILMYACINAIGDIHPFLENVSSTMWYPYKGTGVYINGFDKNNKMNFLPIVKDDEINRGE